MESGPHERNEEANGRHEENPIGLIGKLLVLGVCKPRFREVIFLQPGLPVERRFAFSAGILSSYMSRDHVQETSSQ